MTTGTFPQKLERLISKTARLGVGFLMGLFSFIGMTEFFESGSLWRLFCLFFLTPAFFLFVIFVHEMGHAIAAWSMKYRVHFIAVGGYGFDPENCALRKVENYAKNEIAGFVQYTPRWPLKVRFGDILVSLCGPLATIILGLLLLWLHQNFGYRVDYVDVPGNFPSRIVDEDGRVIMKIGEGSVPNRVQHIGFQLLAIVCFLDAGFNLLPLRFDDRYKSDGRHIIESFFKRPWPVSEWLNARTYFAHYSDQTAVSKIEWQDIRRNYARLCETDENNSAFLRYIAWLKTDPETYIAIAGPAAQDVKNEDDFSRCQYIACRILTARYGEDLHGLLPAESKDDTGLLYFAKALLEHAAGHHDEAVKAASEARQYYQELRGSVPREEDAIFTAIEESAPLPPLKWPPLGK